MNMHDVLSEQR